MLINLFKQAFFKNAVNLKRLARGIALGAATAGLLAMAVQQPAMADDSASVKGKKVIFLTVTEECEYCARHQRAFRKFAEEQGINLQVKINNYDPAEQASQVDQALAEHPDAIVIWPADASAIIPSLRKIKAAGIPLVITNFLPDEKYAKYWDAYTGPDDKGMGVSAGQAMIQGFKDKGMGDKGSIFMVIGVPGTPPQIRRQEGFTQTLAANAPGIEIAGSQPGNWDQTKATEAASALFTQYGSKIKGVYAQADNMMAGVIVAAKRAGIDPTKLVLVGGNCSIEGVNAIEAGTQYASVLQSPVQDGQYAVEALVALLEHKKVDSVRFLPQFVVTKANIQECYSAVGR